MHKPTQAHVSNNEDKQKVTSESYGKWAQARLCRDAITQLDDLAGL